MMRLDKFLTEMGVGSRQEVKKYIKAGQIKVSGEVIKKPEYKINEESDVVYFLDQKICYAKYEYYMLNKPQGVVSATTDKFDQTVLDLIHTKQRKDLFPVGRLDKDTEGLLLITNDGDLAHKLLSPKKHVDKTYYAKVQGCVTDEVVTLFDKGVNIGTDDDPEWTMPAKLTILSSGDESQVRLVIQEGKFHQVKRMFQVLGMKVTFLKRESMGPLSLDLTLNTGEYRCLTEEETRLLYEAVQ